LWLMTNESSQSAEITRLLQAWGAGDSAALGRLIPHVHEELRKLARRYTRKERPGGTLQATALVNEVYLRLVNVRDIRWQDRAHFFAIGAQLMRRILVDAARARSSAKRGGLEQRPIQLGPADLDQVPDTSSCRDRQLVAIDDALEVLAKFDPRKARVIELRFFGGLTVEETAEVLQISAQSVLRDWKLARAWMTREAKRGMQAEGLR
jgi:RNA polymerase sigma factor (TIGR02999 family)